MATPAPLPEPLLVLLLSPPTPGVAGGPRSSNFKDLPRGGNTTSRGRIVLEKAIRRVHEDEGLPRHDRILRAATWVGHSVALGDVGTEDASAALVEAGLALGKPHGEVTRTVEDGLEYGFRRTRAEFPALIAPNPTPGDVLTLPSRLPRRVTAILKAEVPSEDPERDIFRVSHALARAGMGTEYIARAVSWSPLYKAIAARGEAGGYWLRRTIAAAKNAAARAPSNRGCRTTAPSPSTTPSGASSQNSRREDSDAS